MYLFDITYNTYNIKYNGYVGWWVCYKTSVIGSIEVQSFGEKDGAVGDPADSVGVAVIGDDVDGIDIDCDCAIGGYCDTGFVLCI